MTSFASGVGQRFVHTSGSTSADLLALIEHAAHLLPAQGPITSFVHHNTLHAFEHLPFERAVVEGARTFGCHPYLSEETFRDLLDRGRIRPEDIEATLIDDLGDQADELLGFLGTRFHLRQAMLRHRLYVGPTAESNWVIAESDALRRFRHETPSHIRNDLVNQTRHWIMRDLRNGESEREDNDGATHIRSILSRLFAIFDRNSIEQWSDRIWETFCLHLLWQLCSHGAGRVSDRHSPRLTSVRHRDLLFEATGEDSDTLVHDLLIRFCSAFLDQGFAGWTLPGREQGFFRAFLSLYGQPGGPTDRWLCGLRGELQRVAGSGMSPLESINESLQLLGISDQDVEPFLTQTLLALRGYTGMIWQLETRGNEVVSPIPKGSLVDFLAVRLILDRLALACLAEQVPAIPEPDSIPADLPGLRDILRERLSLNQSTSVDQRAFLLFQLAQLLGWDPETLCRLSDEQWARTAHEVESFSGIERRRIYHLAYERHYRINTLDAIRIHSRRVSRPQSRPTFQLACCIDDREESFRRHLEEVDPQCETFSAAGFYAVAMWYRGAADAHFHALCPAILTPKHYVTEEVVYSFVKSDRRRRETRRTLGTASHRYHLGSRTFLGGAVTALTGSLAAIPMVARILFPRLTSRVRRTFGRLVQTPLVTRLHLERTEEEPGKAPGHTGYTLVEMADIVEKILRDMGLTSNFSSLVIMTGHGSSSLNNPHESAYCCGACSGARGGPNARAFAQMANDRRVRELLSQRGLTLPNDVVFVGAYHNTCDDSMTWFDLNELPPSHMADFEYAVDVIDQACERNAHERCRRFESAGLSLQPNAALRHVEGRSEDLSEARPEYNHATNALCFVGRRWWSRGLFLDRRAFLNSYDPSEDDAEHSILTRILQAAVPVCAGINLEYYFSCVDVNGYGCGSKLPHNITAMLGVMTGAASDLRPGLSQQMIEIHEPVRLLFVIETTPEALEHIIAINPSIAELIRGHWVQVATFDPETSDIMVYRAGTFEPYTSESHELPEAESSLDWYRGWRDHLGFATINGRGSTPPQNAR